MTKSHPFLHPQLRLFLFFFLQIFSPSYASDRIDGRYSFSLTTFDQKGRLGQVERAVVAASSLGTPIVAIVHNNNNNNNNNHTSTSITMACPQRLPSPLIQDDGTARFVPITEHIVCAHSGVGADGRILLAACLTLAVNHAFTFDEEIPIEIFLEEMSLLFQEYTIKAGARPFGCQVLVASVGKKNDDDDEARLFRIDPSGAVESVNDCIVIGNLYRSTELQGTLQEIVNRRREEEDSDSQQHQNDSDERALLEALQLALKANNPAMSDSEASDASRLLRIPFLTASLSRDRGLVLKRHEGQ